MFYFDLRHNVKEKSKTGKRTSSLNAFYYIARLKHFAERVNDLDEEVEFCASGNLPAWANGQAEKFWATADFYERDSARTSSHITIALPKELSKAHRIELAKNLIHAFCGEFELPFSSAIHNHKGALDQENDQPHLHLQYSERTSIDGIERPAEQFFKQYRPKNPALGGAQKLTADALKMGRHQIRIYRQLTEKLINASLESHASTKQINIRGLNVEVPNIVSCLSHEDYNKKFKTQLKEVPQIPRWMLHSADPIVQLDLKPYLENVKKIREENNFEMYKNYYYAELRRRKVNDIQNDNILSI